MVQRNFSIQHENPPDLNTCNHFDPLGFSLLELLIAVSILAIIALISFGDFNEHSVSVKRKNAQMALLSFTQQLHLYHNQHYSYAGASLALYADFLPLESSATNADYQLNLAITDENQGFVITAKPINHMTGSGGLTINHYGDRRWYTTNDQASGDTFNYW